VTDYYDRDGNPMPDDWWDKKKYDGKYTGHATNRRVASTDVADHRVSTVWLGLDHSHIQCAPIIFETMVFGPRWDHDFTRYETEERASRGHWTVVDRLRTGRPPFEYLDDDQAEE
jgi:hypothetical protein